MGNQNQDKFDQTNTNHNGTAAANSSTDTAAQTPTNGADDMLKLMGENQKTCGLGQWMKCLRKPALSMQYTVEKRHIPDLDADGAGKSDGTAPDPTGSDANSRHAVSPKGASPAPQGGEPTPAAQDSSRAPVCHKGQNTDLMTVTGGFTIRYFDLAAGMLGILLAGCLLRGCCWVRRKMK